MTNKEKVNGLYNFINDNLGFDIAENSRRLDCVIARGVFAVYSRKIGYSYEGIGKIINRTHATILNSIEKADGLKNHDFYITCKNIAEQYLNTIGYIEAQKTDAIIIGLKNERDILMDKVKAIDLVLKNYK